jgi:hypothetical protein
MPLLYLLAITLPVMFKLVLSHKNLNPEPNSLRQPAAVPLPSTPYPSS